MKIHGWGRYPILDASVKVAQSTRELTFSEESLPTIAAGLGRSYGDSALSQHVIKMTSLDNMLHFDRERGILTGQAGLSLYDILQVIVPCGWFLPATPGTKFVTLGGAVASDVHGKNHHLHGSFCDHVISLDLLLPNGQTITCSAHENIELFRATCAGMGLTGIVTSVTLQLMAIESSFIDQTTYKAQNLAHAIEIFEANHESTYSVAWIDCLSQGSQLGRSLVMLGEHSRHGGFAPPKKPLLRFPIDLPAFCLNRYSISAFNHLYYHRIRKDKVLNHVHYDPFFYPLDRILDWNKMYGRKGFLQYQFVLPQEAGLKGMTEILQVITASKRGSFLAVLKKFGAGNDNFLSFPTEGLTLALDFKYDSHLLPWLDELDKIVLNYGGRIYLAKDARMARSTFENGYPNHQQFKTIRKNIGADQCLQSLQSQRLGL